MNIYRITIEPKSAFRSRLQSDTIFGHLLWALRYTAGANGNQELADFLERYRAGEPPLLVSAGFPEDTLPTPTLSRPTPDTGGPVAGQVVRDLLRKAAGELRYLPLDQWPALVNNLSGQALGQMLEKIHKDLQALPNSKQIEQDYRRQHKVQAITRTAVDRITGSAREGQLFVAQETFYRRPARFDIWHKIFDESDLDRLKACWRWIEGNGFGKRKSTGAGAFKITRLLEAANEVLPQADRPNGFMSLSAWVPARTDPPDVSYKTRVKRGKLAEQYAIPGPWKKPLLMLEPGAVARLLEGEPGREWYGQLVEDMHWTHEGIVQYGYAFPLPVYLSEEVK